MKQGFRNVNDNGQGSMLSTLRERQRFVPLVILWILLSLFCGFAGPFGTHDALPFLPRLCYWALACGVSIALSVLAFGGDAMSLRRRIIVNVVFVLGLSIAIYGLNAWLFDRTGWSQFLYLLGTVLATTVVINGVFWLIRKSYDTAPDVKESATLNRFVLRLPLDRRGPLYRLEAQDHYVLAVTEKGQTMILMRFADALEEVAPLRGLQVHRSHWIMPQHALRAHRENGRDLIEMPDGIRVPVSRKFRAAAKEIGLI